MTKKEQVQTLMQLQKVWNHFMEFALASGMDETSAARFASREMDEFVKECAATVSK